jgi:hypothetical protein
VLIDRSIWTIFIEPGADDDDDDDESKVKQLIYW